MVVSGTAHESTPNIVLVITDQQRYDTIAEWGFDYAITPTLDRLAREGTSFVNTFVSSPSCSPSRASLFSGMYAHSVGLFRNEESWQHSWVEDLARAGYRCINVGKMHTSPWETPLGFHERVVIENKDRSGAVVPFLHDHLDHALRQAGQKRQTREEYRTVPGYSEKLGAFEWALSESLHPDVFTGAEAVWWLDTYPTAPPAPGRPGGEPFFLQVGFPGPHPPYDPVPSALSKYDGRDVPAACRSAGERETEPAALSELRQFMEDDDIDAVAHRSDADDADTKRQRKHYLANVTMIDEQIRLIMEALERRGVLENTVIIFTSDHGDCLGDHGHSQKWNMYEPVIHVPAIVWGPSCGISVGQVREGLTEMMDLGPTILELAGVPVPEWFEARSLVPALRGEDYAWRDMVFAEHARDEVLKGTELMMMARSSRWKLVTFIDSEEFQLFDLSADPYELNNLAAEAKADPTGEAGSMAAYLARRISRWYAKSDLDTAERYEALR